MSPLLVLILLVVVHELGHYIAFRVYDFKPRFGFRYGLITIGDNINLLLTPAQYVIVAFSGIILGAIPLLFVNDFYWVYVYIGMCIVDLFGIVSIIYITKFLKIYKGVRLGLVEQLTLKKRMINTRNNYEYQLRHQQ